jgi:hypothetical protein
MFHRFFLLLIFTIVLTSGCRKDEEIVNREKILGTWISEDQNDTLDFTDKSNFYKNGDHFDYTLYNDSIEVAYSGRLLILVIPSKHKYQLKGDNLIIDFSNRHCYGFDMKVEQFTRQ